jgi:hypothetical protein
VTGRDTALVRARAVREVLLDYGVPEVSIELQPGRPSGTDVWNSLNPVMVTSHHIASRPTPENPVPGLRIVKGGRSDLGPPLCNGTAGVDLVYRILCLGWANHPGFGGPLTVRGPLGSFTIPKDNARPYAWGTEYEGGYSDEVWDRIYTNRRTGKRMTFREFMGRANGGLCEAIWLPGLNSHGNYDDIRPGMDLSGYHGEHSTWAPTRKIDRRNYTTESGRAEIRRYATKTEEDDMFDEKDRATLKRIEAAVDAGAKADKERDQRIARRIAKRLNAAEADVLAAIEAANAEEPAPGEA